ncbi:hypothetical protein [Rhodococcus sp. BS-15]|nr:hypothetical protein [Rhodococcus sp. BS-15]
MTTTLQTLNVAESSGGRDEEQPQSVCNHGQSLKVLDHLSMRGAVPQ